MTTTRRTVLTGALAALATGAGVVATAPAASAATSTTLRIGSRGAAVTAVQQRLNALGYWVGTPTGYYGTQTAQAVMALQKVAGLTRDGALGPMTRSALSRGVRPVPRSRSGHVIEVDKARQVLVVADGGRASRIYNVSSGGEYRYYSQGRWQVAHTPTGTWRIYRAVPSWESGPLGAMYRSHYVVGGIAIHGVASPSGVGAFGASHGCVRTTTQTQDELIRSGAMRVGTTVTIY